MIKKLLLFLVLIISIGLLIPQKFVMPVFGASKVDYNQETFWYSPWGSSCTHKGVDIFAKEGTELFSSTHGIVIAKGNMSKGGNFVLILGPKWRIHYYAHLRISSTELFKIVHHNSIIGEVGSTGNANGKEPHVHYSILTLIPYPWKVDFSPQGWKKMFYLDPIPLLNDT
ncbi:MAG: M23 family metallopeptidase [Balneolaceae bacterium]